MSGSVCPLVFPNMTHVVKECANVITSQTACCKAMDSYVSQLQEQSFITNLQALNCAASLGVKLQKANVSNNVYELCHINLKDFSLQGLFCYIWLNGRRNVMLLYSCNFVRKIDANQCFSFLIFHSWWWTLLLEAPVGSQGIAYLIIETYNW